MRIKVWSLVGVSCLVGAMVSCDSVSEEDKRLAGEAYKELGEIDKVCKSIYKNMDRTLAAIREIGKSKTMGGLQDADNKVKSIQAKIDAAKILAQLRGAKLYKKNKVFRKMIKKHFDGDVPKDPLEINYCSPKILKTVLKALKKHPKL